MKPEKRPSLRQLAETLEPSNQLQQDALRKLKGGNGGDNALVPPPTPPEYIVPDDIIDP